MVSTHPISTVNDLSTCPFGRRKIESCDDSQVSIKTFDAGYWAL
jgi:hypothetical protein